jgi:hypothetical protein
MNSGSLVVALVTVLLFLTSAASARYITMDEVWMLVSVCAAAIATFELFLLNRRRRLLLLDPWRRRFFVRRSPVLRSRCRSDVHGLLHAAICAADPSGQAR